MKENNGMGFDPPGHTPLIRHWIWRYNNAVNIMLCDKARRTWYRPINYTYKCIKAKKWTLTVGAMAPTCPPPLLTTPLLTALSTLAPDAFQNNSSRASHADGRPRRVGNGRLCGGEGRGRAALPALRGRSSAVPASPRPAGITQKPVRNVLRRIGRDATFAFLAAPFPTPTAPPPPPRARNARAGKHRITHNSRVDDNTKQNNKCAPSSRTWVLSYMSSVVGPVRVSPNPNWAEARVPPIG